MPILAICGSDSSIILWDYIRKESTLYDFEHLDKEYPTTMTFTPNGDELLIGNSNAVIMVLDTKNNLRNKNA